MKHSLIAQGYGIRLRPVRLEDAPFIVWLRNLDYVRGRVGDSAENIESQKQWLNRYFEREGDYYFLVETQASIPLGTYAVYNLIEHRAEIGRMVIRPEVPAVVPATVLLLDLSYGQMEITQLRAATVASNIAIHSFLRKGGFRKVEVEAPGRIIGGQAIDLTYFVQTDEDWRRTRERGVMAALRGESAILQWERSHLARSSPTLIAEV
jgi:RimJ/RimL family protein N-acetyltransferase